MKTIWKFPLRLADVQEVMMPMGAVILDIQDQAGIMCIWAMVNSQSEVIPRYFYIYGTGHELLAKGQNHIATVQQGPLVWHIFEQPL